MSNEPKYLMWCDLETTGTNEAADVVLEVACVVTDLDGDGRIGSFDRVIRPAVPVENMMVPIVKEMHTKSGLLNDVRTAAYDHAEVETQWVEFLAGIGEPHDFVLAGSGVAHFDRRFIKHDFPKVDKYLRYYALDVGVLRRTLRYTGNEDLIPPIDTTKTHRASGDLLLHLTEYRYYRETLKEVPRHAVRTL